MHSNAKSFGTRKVYAYIENEVGAGETLAKNKVKKKEMFSKDAPSGAIEFSKLTQDYYAFVDIPSNVILTKKMLTTSTDEISSYQRIIFIPSTIEITTKSRKTDLVAITEYGSEVVATNASIVSSHSKIESEKGHYVLVNIDEANEIANALSSGEIYFSLIPYS